jgi:hypothetical protein
MEPANTEDPSAPYEGRHRSEDISTALHHQGRHRRLDPAGTPTRRRARWNGVTSEQPLIEGDLREATT